MSRPKRYRALSLAVLALGLCGVAPGWAAVTKGGDTTVARTSSDDTTVGNTGIGTLSIDGGSSLTNRYSYLGYHAGSSGTATVSGPGSKWAGGIYSTTIGRSGTGMLTIEAGGQVSSNNVTILGENAGSIGTVAVSGVGSSFASYTHYVGKSGNGTLSIADGGQVSGAVGRLGDDAGSTGMVTVSGAGSVWTDGAYFDIGRYGSGTLRIENGGRVDISNGTGIGARLGIYAGSNGSATVSGPGSKWTMVNELFVGSSGNGTLSITSGGVVSNRDGYIGNGTTAVGSVEVIGAGSTWTNSSHLYVGHYGSSSLTVADGGLVTARDIYASLSDLHGNGTINARGAVLDTDLVFDSTHGLTQTLAFGSGGTLNLTVDGTANLGVGYRGSGSLRIADGVAVASTSGSVGARSGSAGIALVSGIGSAWTMSGSLGIGNGVLSVEAGGQVSSVGGSLGGSDGRVTVCGTDSKWISSGLIRVGSSGSGRLTVTDGGQVITKTLQASLTDLYGNGTITANGAVLDTELVFDSTHGPTQTLAFGSGGTLNLLVDGTGYLGAGHKGSGSLRVRDGVVVASPYGYLGYSTGSMGTATVSGAGSKWSCTTLYIGNFGSGTVTVDAGGQVSAANAYLAYEAGSSGAVTITGAGSKWTGGSLYVGRYGNGTLNVEAGGRLTGSCALGYSDGSMGVATVSGAGSWMSSASVGAGGMGVLRVEDGGQVDGGIIGQYDGSTGTATVSGSGSKWTTRITVGESGNGTLRVENGGQVSVGSGVIAYHTDSIGRVTVSGAGSAWTNSLDFYIGRLGDGALTVEAGGQVTSRHGYLGYDSGATGSAKVSGAASAWTSSGTLYVGSYGSGMLTVSDGGRVAATALSINNKSVVRLELSGSDMVVLGNATTHGTITNNGVVSLFADALLPVGTYRPFSAYPGRSLIWSGTGSCKAFGGTWNNTAQTFTVAELAALAAGDVETVTTGERLLFTHETTGQRVGASFGTITGTVSFSAALTGAADLAGLAGVLEQGRGVLSAWNFTTNFSGGEAMLSFDVGTGAEELAIWRYSGGVWSAFTPSLFTYDANGIASFTVSSFSGYAVTAAVPEPGALTLLGLAGSMLLARRRGRA